MYRHAFRVLAQRAAPVATAAAATALVVAPPSRCDWWSSKKPSAPAPAAAAAPPVVEPKTGVEFPAEQGGLKLAGCGVRVKYGFIKVYAVGVYLCGNQIRAPHVSVAASVRWRGDSTPSTRRCPCGCAGSMAWRSTKVHAIFLRIT